MYCIVSCMTLNTNVNNNMHVKQHVLTCEMCLSCVSSVNKANCFILITVICSHTRKPNGLDNKSILEVHMDSLRPPPPYPWPHPSPQRSESAKARSTNKQRDEQQKAHILTVGALQLLNWKVEKSY